MQCVPDLQIVFAKVNISEMEGDRIILGTVASITVTVAVRNRGENAYNTRLIATFPHELVYRGLIHGPHLLSCQQLRDITETNVTCDIGNPLQSGSAVEFGIDMSVIELTTPTQEFRVGLKALSDNPENETTMDDNMMMTDAIRTVAQANFGIEGIAVPSRIPFDSSRSSVENLAMPHNEFEIGQHVNHTYYVINSGPAGVGELELVISWPWKIKNGSYLLYVTSIEHSESAHCEAEGLIDPLGLLDSADSNEESSNSIPDSAAIHHLPEEECKYSEYTLCVPISCHVHYLPANGTAEIWIVSRLFERSLFQSKTFVLNVTSTANISTNAPNLTILAGHRRLFNVTTAITGPITDPSDEEIEIWILAVAAGGTLLILIVLVVLLAYFGFFRRSKKEQLNKEKKLLEEEVRMLSMTKVDCT
jgi:hypothetical protein